MALSSSCRVPYPLIEQQNVVPVEANSSGFERSLSIADRSPTMLGRSGGVRHGHAAAMNFSQGTLRYSRFSLLRARIAFSRDRCGQPLLCIIAVSYIRRCVSKVMDR